MIGASAIVTEAEIEEKDNRKQRRVLKIGVSCFCLLLFAVVLPVAVILPGKRKDEEVDASEAPSEVASASPTSSTFLELLQTLEPLYPSKKMFNKAFSDFETPQYRAAEWAATVGRLDLAGSDARMISRFALASFFYSTNGETWTRCAQESAGCDVEQSWLLGEDECKWLFVSCHDPDVGDHGVKEIFFSE